MLSLQSIVLAARLAGVAAIDGVFNRLDDPRTVLELVLALARPGEALPAGSVVSPRDGAAAP